MSFSVTGLDPAPFEPLFALGEAELSARGATRLSADQADAYPCRVGLRRVEAGEDLLLVNHVHQPVATSPYRASGPIFVGRGSRERARVEGELPPMLRDRMLSLRAYDSRAFIVDAEVGEGAAALAIVRRFLANPEVEAVHAHFARRGCYAALIERL